MCGEAFAENVIDRVVRLHEKVSVPKEYFCELDGILTRTVQIRRDIDETL